jgi:hypothetical protein
MSVFDRRLTDRAIVKRNRNLQDELLNPKELP